jgi:hypothetical protein
VLDFITDRIVKFYFFPMYEDKQITLEAFEDIVKDNDKKFLFPDRFRYFYIFEFVFKSMEYWHHKIFDLNEKKKEEQMRRVKRLPRDSYSSMQKIGGGNFPPKPEQRSIRSRVH